MRAKKKVLFSLVVTYCFCYFLSSFKIYIIEPVVPKIKNGLILYRIPA